MASRVPAEWAKLIEEVDQRRTYAYQGGGSSRIAREHKAGRLTVRERIELLVDEGTFVEYGTFVTTPTETGDQLPSTFVCGTAEIDGRMVALGLEDFTVEGGGVGVHLDRYKGSWGGFIEEVALHYRIPLVLLMQGVGGSVALQEEKGYPELLAGVSVYPVFELLSEVPVVTAVLGPTAGSSAARASIAHFSVMARDNGCLFAGGPPLVRHALGLDIDKMDLGGAQMHVVESGIIDNAVDSEEDAVDHIRLFLSYLPSNVSELPPHELIGDPADRPIDEVLEIVSPDARHAYDVQALVDTVVDEETFFEIAPDHGQALRIGLARIDGHPVGILATDARHNAGAMDVDSSEKQTRFVEMCNAFHLPLVYFVDVPGFMVGPDAERSGLLRKGSQAVRAIQSATVPVYTVQVRRSYGLAAQGTGSPNPLSVRLAWPSGEWGDMPVGGGIEAAHRAELEAAENKEALRAELTKQYEEQSSPWRTVEKFGVEEMIDPRDTRRRLSSLLQLARHATIPGPKNGPSVRG
jgi:acetyl-CoA carboxylase carboxyltransferase component